MVFIICAEQTLHTDSFSSSLSFVGKFAGELGVRRLASSFFRKDTGTNGKRKRELG
jgi:hypothetical protein